MGQQPGCDDDGNCSIAGRRCRVVSPMSIAPSANSFAPIRGHLRQTPVPVIRVVRVYMRSAHPGQTWLSHTSKGKSMPPGC